MKTALMAVFALLTAPVAPAQTVLSPGEVEGLAEFPIDNIVFSPKGGTVYASGYGRVYLWNPETGALKNTIQIPTGQRYSTQAESISISGDERYLCTTHWPYSALIWDLRNNGLLTVMQQSSGTPPSPEPYTHAEFIPSTGRILLSSPIRVVQMWDFMTGEFIQDMPSLGVAGNMKLFDNNRKILLHKGSKTVIEAFPDGERLFEVAGFAVLNEFSREILSRDVEWREEGLFKYRFKSYSLDTYDFLYDSNLYAGDNYAVVLSEVSPDGKFVVRGKTADSPEPTRLADLDTTLPVRTLNGGAAQYDRAYDVEFAPNGRSVAVSYGDRILLYDISDLTASVKDPGLHGNE